MGVAVKILVTGAAGFLGSHVVDALAHSGHSVGGVDNLSTGKLEWCAVPLERDTFEESRHLRDSDVIVHCAAVADISRNWIPFHNRNELWRTNVEDTLAMLERLALGAACKHLIFISTAAVDSPQQSPYTASKIAGEAMCKAYCQALGIHLTIVRPVSMLGKRYHHGHIVDFVRMAARDGVIRAKDNGRQRKPYCHVKDVAKHIADEALDPSPGMCITTVVPGVAWGIAWTAELLKCPITFGVDDRGWKGDPDVSAYTSDSPTNGVATWVQETIDWCRSQL